ncbi:MAG: very short patch repair endonuclease [Armatimonadetes bacterium]|nr:very short patch repair endonuclease [Armatimonadota bacterium]
MALSVEATLKSMRSNKATDTVPELKLRRALWQAGLRGYRKNVRGLSGRPDIVFPRSRVVIFVHGCFWHGCPRCGKQTIPNSNSEFWREKFRRTSLRDARNVAELGSSGFAVIVVWECEIVSSVPEVVSRIRSALKLSSR